MRTFSTSLRASASVAALMTALSAAPALAQEFTSQDEAFFGDGDQPFLLETIIIEGELLARDIQDTPTSVVVITGEDLEKQGNRGILDEIRKQPNVDISGVQSGFRIRGIDQRGVGGGGLGLTISTQIDGVALPSNQAFFFGPYSAWDLQQIEVLRGPQSTQQGRNALAGAIIIRSQDPTYEEEVKSQLQFGSNNTVGAAIAINQPLIDETLAVRFSAEGFTSDGDVTNVTTGDDKANATDRTTLRAKLRWDPNPDLNITFNYTRSRNFGGQDRLVPSAFPDDRIILTDITDFEGSVQQIAGVRVEYQLSDIWSLEAETSFFDDNYERFEDADGTADPLGFLDRTGTSEVFEQDIRLRFDTTTMTGVIGFFYTETETDNPSTRVADASLATPLPPGLITATEEFSFGSEVENYAIYGEVEYDASAFIDGLSFTVGARYDNEQITNVSRSTFTIQPDLCSGTPGPIIGLLCGLLPESDPGSRSQGDFSAFLPKFGVTYDWTPDISTSFTAQRSYRSGGAELIPDVNNNNTLSLNEFDPEFTWTYEFAVRAQFMDQRLTTNANIFFTDWQDQQLNVDVDPNNTILGTKVVNAGESQLWGAELQVEYEATPELNIFGSFGYLNTEFTDFVNDGVNLNGNEFPNAPTFTALIGGSYEFANGLTWSGDIVYNGSGFFDVENTEVKDSFVVVNTSLTYEWDDNYSATLFARNLFDEDYVLTQFLDTITVGEARTIGVVLNASF